MSQRFWQPARREFIYLALAGMDTCVLLPLSLSIGQFFVQFPQKRATLAFFLVILISFNLVRALDALKLKTSVQRDVGFGVLVVWIILTLRLTLYRHYSPFSLAWIVEMVGHVDEEKMLFQDLSIVFIVLAFWWRGLALAGRPLDFALLGSYFRIGVLLMAGTVAITSRLLGWSPIPYILGYFFLSLLALALARAEEVGRWRAGLPFPFSAGWLVSVIMGAGTVVLIAAGLIAIFTGENLLHILAFLGPVWEGISFLIAGLLTLLFILLNPLFTALVNLILRAAEESGVQVPDLTILVPELEPDDTLTNPPTTNFALYQPILTGLLVLAAVLIVALTFNRLWRARQQLGHVETRPVTRESDSLADRARKGLSSLIGQIGFLNRWYTAASIRRIYAQMVATAGRRGYPRADSETPLEFLPTLVNAWPDLEVDMGAVTDAYVRVHYGELPETIAELEAIRAAWKRIQSEAR
jgi:hypothetical protein